eukprot:1161611-Pelagomonas_calceolata.AAC.1
MAPKACGLKRGLTGLDSARMTSQSRAGQALESPGRHDGDARDEIARDLCVRLVSLTVQGW